jgi:hypothetical protein
MGEKEYAHAPLTGKCFTTILYPEFLALLAKYK